jgi:chromosome segregation ATPase
MFKKLLIASVAVIAGTVVLGKVTHISPKVWFGDCCKAVKNMVPPEVKLKQLRADIENIDRDIDKNLGTLARMATEVDQFADNLARNRDRQAHLRTDISEMHTTLKDQAQRVVYRGKRCGADELTCRLEMAVTEFNCLKDKVKIQEKILAEKRRTLAAAKEKITAMKNEQQRLRVLAERLEGDLELVRMREIHNQAADFDTSALAHAQQTAKDVDTSLREIEHRIEYMKEFGRSDTATVESIKGKSREEVLHDAKEALRNHKDVTEAIADIDNDNK